MSDPSPLPPPTARPRSERRSVWIGLVGVLLAGAAYTAVWFTAAAQLRDAALAWIEARRAEGYGITFGRFDIEGFPFLLRAIVTDPAVKAPPGRGAWEWRGPTARVEARPWSLASATAHLPGRHWLSLGEQQTYVAEAAEFDLRVEKAGAAAATALLHVESLSLASGDGAPLIEIAGADGAARSLETPNPDHRTPTLEMKLLAENVSLRGTPDLPLGQSVGQVGLEAALLGRIPPASSSAEAFALWRDDGGTVEVRRLNLDYGPLSLQADGTAALDAGLQPIVAFTARLQGFFETVDALRARGVIRDGDAVTAKIVLGALAGKGAGESKATLSAPVTIQGRMLFVGPVALFHLPEIRW